MQKVSDRASAKKNLKFSIVEGSYGFFLATHDEKLQNIKNPVLSFSFYKYISPIKSFETDLKHLNHYYFNCCYWLPRKMVKVAKSKSKQIQEVNGMFRHFSVDYL